MDEIERELEAAIERARRRGDNDTAHELTIQLAQYRKFYKIATSFGIPADMLNAPQNAGYTIEQLRGRQ